MAYNAGMHKMTRHWSACAWIACLAILFNAFAPILSHATESRDGAPGTVAMEVCTALGMEMMPVAWSDTSTAPEKSRRPASDRLHRSMSDCACCVAHVVSHGLPPPMAARFAPIAGRDVYPPPPASHSPRPLFPWSLAQPRAPPPLA
jgi:hypothetical protein